MLFRPRTHGFYRLWAWEAIVGLLVLQAPAWFRKPFRPQQLLSWLFLCLSVVPLVLGVRSLKGGGRPSSDRPDPALLGVERTTALVTTGIYRYIRRPLYTSLLLLAWGAFLKAPGRLAAALASTASILVYRTARIEERENVAYFGPAYVGYMRRSRRFVPFLFSQPVGDSALCDRLNRDTLVA